jgi:DNA-binding response OmpR family regulator
MPVILIAEDDVDIRNLMGMALKVHKLDVIEAFDGKDALHKTLLHHPDLLVLDIAMPHMSGFEVCEQIRAHQDLAELPIIFISAKVDQHEIQKCRAMGVETLIEKPFDFGYLVSKIHALLQESGTGRCL